MQQTNEYNTLMNGFNQCDLMLGLEQQSEQLTKRLPVWSVGVKIFENKSHYRLVIDGVCGMMVCRETFVIAHMFTKLFERRRGHMKALFAVAHHALKGVQHGELCTEDGQKFKDSYKG